MPFNKKKGDDFVDPTSWMVDSGLAQFVLMHTNAIKYMCLLGYTYMAGFKVFPRFGPNDSMSYKFVNLIFACTGGGILVPIFINGIPVPLAQDVYMIAILCSFALHHYFPILREVVNLSPIVKVWGIILFEVTRAFVVCNLTSMAAAKIPPSQFSFPVFGPIMCGASAGCGAAFFPLNKGLDPLKKGLATPMLSALVSAACYHLYLSVPGLSDDVVDAPKKARAHVAVFLILVGLVDAYGLNKMNVAPAEVEMKLKKKA